MKHMKRILAGCLACFTMFLLLAGCAEQKNLLKPFAKKERAASYYVALGEYLGVEAKLIRLRK